VEEFIILCDDSFTYIGGVVYWVSAWKMNAVDIVFLGIITNYIAFT
jgi:hypothetical protein